MVDRTVSWSELGKAIDDFADNIYREMEALTNSRPALTLLV